MPKSPERKYLIEGLEYPLEEEAGFDGLASGINPDTEDIFVNITENKHEIIELPPLKEHIYLKDGIEEWFRLVDNFNYANIELDQSPTMEGEKLSGLEKQVWERFLRGCGDDRLGKEFSHYGFLASWTMFLKGIDKYQKEYGTKFPATNEIESLIGESADEVMVKIGISGLKLRDELIPQQVDPDGIFAVLKPFKEEIINIESVPEERDDKINELFEQAYDAGLSIRYRNWPKQWSVCSKKISNLYDDLVIFYDQNQIDDKVLPPKLNDLDWRAMTFGAKLYNQLVVPKYFAEKMSVSIDNSIMEKISRDYISLIDANQVLRKHKKDVYPEIDKMEKAGRFGHGEHSLMGFAPFLKFFPATPFMVKTEIAGVKEAEQLYPLFVAGLQEAANNSYVASVINEKKNVILIENLPDSDGIKISYELDPKGKISELIGTNLSQDLKVYGGLIVDWTLEKEEDLEAGVGYIYFKLKKLQ